MRFFEYGVLKTGDHPVAWIKGALYQTDAVGPTVELAATGSVLGEVHELSQAEAKERVWQYTGYHIRVARIADTGEAARIFVADGVNVHADGVVPTGIWLTPRTRGRVYCATLIDGTEFYGSLREIIEQIYREQYTQRGKRLFKHNVARHVAAMHRRDVRTDTIENFVLDLVEAHELRLRVIWPRNKTVIAGRRN